MFDRHLGSSVCLGIFISLALAAPAAARELRDPTRRPVVVSPPPRASVLPGPKLPERRLPVLTATLVSPERRVAIIDGQPVAEGDQVGTARLVEVGPAKAVLRQDGQDLTLRLAGQERKGFRKTAREDQQ